MARNAMGTESIRKELVEAVEKFAFSTPAKPVYSTYTSGERRGEGKTKSKDRQERVFASIVDVLKDE